MCEQTKWSRYRPGVAQRMGRSIALLFHERGTRRGWVVSSTPRPHFTPGKEPVPILQGAGWAPQGRSGRTENLVPTGIRSRTVQPVFSRYTDWATRPTNRQITSQKKHDNVLNRTSALPWIFPPQTAMSFVGEKKKDYVTIDNIYFHPSKDCPLYNGFPSPTTKFLHMSLSLVSSSVSPCLIIPSYTIFHRVFPSYTLPPISVLRFSKVIIIMILNQITRIHK